MQIWFIIVNGIVHKCSIFNFYLNNCILVNIILCEDFFYEWQILIYVKIVTILPVLRNVRDKVINLKLIIYSVQP